MEIEQGDIIRVLMGHKQNDCKDSVHIIGVYPISASKEHEKALVNAKKQGYTTFNDVQCFFDIGVVLGIGMTI